MFVDDEPAVLAALAHQFQRYTDLKVYLELDGREVLRRLEQNPVDLVVADFQMPGMNGLELLDEVSRLYPDIRGAILSGHAEVRPMLRARQGKPLPPFFSKPWNNRALRRAIRSLLHLSTPDDLEESPAQAAA